MNDHSLAFLKRLLATPGPSGDEVAVGRIWRREAETFADRVYADVRGSSYAVLEGGSPRVLLAGHIDEIGVMVSSIDDDGFLWFSPIGGWDPQVLVGQRVRLAGRAGDVIGVIGKKPIHQMKPDEREKASKVEDLWIDIGRDESGGSQRTGAYRRYRRDRRTDLRSAGREDRFTQHRRPDWRIHGAGGAPLAGARPSARNGGGSGNIAGGNHVCRRAYRSLQFRAAGRYCG
jgi:hypothetical protein